MSDELKAKLKQDAGLKHAPTNLTYDCRMAIGGDGPRAYEWIDKPHRLVYDLCIEIERNAERAAELEAEVSTILALLEIAEAAKRIVADAATNTATGDAIITCAAEDVFQIRTALEGVKK